MQKMKTLMMILVLPFLLIGCSTAGKEQKEDEKAFYIGILQLASHPALDAIAEGVVEQLEAEGYIDGKNAVIDLQNAQGDQSNMQSIAERFLANDADVMIGIATPAAQTLANATEDIPIILGAITDPVEANLVDSLEKPGRNITGVSDQLPIQEQFEFMVQLLPEVHAVGLLYSSSEDNSRSAGKEAEKIAESLGLKTVTKTINSANDVPQIAESLAEEVDAVWVPTDNMIATSTAALVAVTDDYQIPVFPSVDTMVEEGGLAAIGLNQYRIGKQTGKIAADILKGEDPALYPIQFPEEIEWIINEKKAEQLHITIPDEIKEKARKVNPN